MHLLAPIGDTPHAIDRPTLSELWILRILVPLGGQRGFVEEAGFSNDTVAALLGLGKWLEPSAADFDPKAVRAQLRRLHTACERRADQAIEPEYLRRNVERLSSLVGLSETDRRILELAVMLHSDRVLDDAADWLGPLNSIKLFHVISTLLQVSPGAVRDSLSPSGVLARSGLVSVDRNRPGSLRGKLDLISGNFADHITSSDADPISLLRETVSLAPEAQLRLTDYAHVAETIAIIRPYLMRAIETGRKGVNFFIHGAPGTGKSEFARALARDIGLDLFEVASADADGDPVSGERRLRAYRAAQCFFSQRRAAIVFDEVEDVFNDGIVAFGNKSTAQMRKAWINRMLEDNPVPALWLSNSIDLLDRAFIRRFDMVFELPVPARQHRVRILRETCGDLLPPSGVERIAGSDALTPAVAEKAASVIRAIRHEFDSAGAARAVERLINNTLTAQGHCPLRTHDPDRLPEIYDPRFIHADAELDRLADGIVASRSARLCLYGPPGTGKTAYGRWLAERLQVPLLVRRASDLMSKWVGDNEKNIAHAFRQAEQDGALLLIDEVDSFLQDRRAAQRGWEVSLVNEMLTQMESFPGVFIASTNLLDGLDQAALRRFDLKVRFDFLKPDQAEQLLRRHCTMWSLAEPSHDQVTRVRRLRHLTPGDFAVLARQRRFLSHDCAAALVAALEAEVCMKGGSASPMGFHA